MRERILDKEIGDLFSSLGIICSRRELSAPAAKLSKVALRPKLRSIQKQTFQGKALQSGGLMP